MSETARRLRLYGSRLARVVTGGLRQPCVFLHLPKCGGTSLAEALYACVPLHRRIGLLDAIATRRAASILLSGEDALGPAHEDFADGHRTFELREGMLLTHMAMGCPLIHGHVFWSEAAHTTVGADYGWVTVMRPPAERALSNFRFAVQMGEMSADVEAWLAGPQGRSHAQAALRYLSAQNIVPEEELAAAEARVEAALDRLALVGFTDRMEAFLDRFAAQFGPRPRPRRLNETKGPEITLTPAQRDRLDELCAPDQRLYDLARERFG
ncbi:MAG: hypothetical protein AAGI70_17425 [Pseudomonadota bacterium]